MSATNKVILITGASSGFGQACAAYLSERGYRVYGTSRRVPAGEVQAVAPNWWMIHMDVTDDDSVRDAVALVMSREETLDGVFNNAGAGISGAIEETTMAEAKALFETNFFGVLRVCQAALPIMRQQGYGHLVTTSSIGGRIAVPFQGFYNASKFALEGLIETLRYEVAPLGMQVVLIEPGDFQTGFTGSRRYVAQAQSPDSPYAAAFRQTMQVVETDETTGSQPVLIASLLLRILATPNPRLRYTVGAAFQRIAVVLKGLLPWRLFEFALAKYYGLR